MSWVWRWGVPIIYLATKFEPEASEAILVKIHREMWQFTGIETTQTLPLMHTQIYRFKQNLNCNYGFNFFRKKVMVFLRNFFGKFRQKGSIKKIAPSLMIIFSDTFEKILRKENATKFQRKIWFLLSKFVLRIFFPLYANWFSGTTG